MRKLIAFLAAFAALAVYFFFSSPETKAPPAVQASGTLEFQQDAVAKAQRALAAIDLPLIRGQFDKMIVSAIVDAPWGDPRGLSWAARESLYEATFCSQIFANGEGLNKRCRDVFYGTYPGHTTDIPLTIFPIAQQVRSKLFEIGREYLKTPEVVQALYKEKKELIVETINRLSAEKRAERLQLIDNAIAAFEMYRDDAAARALYIGYREAEDAWIATHGCTSDDAWDKYRAASKALSEKVGDYDKLSLYLFAARRDFDVSTTSAEGGDKLTTVYLASLQDLREALGTK